jgi:hypothetical protein
MVQLSQSFNLPQSRVLTANEREMTTVQCLLAEDRSYFVHAPVETARA